MTSLFSVLAHEDANDQTKLRQAMALAKQRVEDRFGSFVRQGSVDDQAARMSLVEEDMKAVVVAACEQVGYAPAGPIFGTIIKDFVTADAAPQLRTAGVRHEARKPKMCPYHSEVTDISLAAGDPSAGFNAMAQHAWGKNHCQGGEYEGDRCKFKPAMTTQAYWDERAEKAEQRRQERAEREEQAIEVQTLDHEDPATQEEFVDGVQDALAEEPQSETPAEPSAIGEGVDESVDAIPMAMAASTKTADGTPSPKMDKRKWTPKTVPHDQPLKADDPDGPHPTKRKDVVEPITQEADTPDNKSKLNEIGEQVTEHQDVTQKGGPAKTDQGGTFGGGERSAVSSLLDPDAVKEALTKFKRD